MESRTITRHSMFSGAVNTRTITVPASEWAALEAGELIQVAMPSASADDREFLISGATPEEWEGLFSEQQDEAEHDDMEEVAHVRQPFSVDCECAECCEDREGIVRNVAQGYLSIVQPVEFTVTRLAPSATNPSGWDKVDTSVEDDDCPF